MSGTLESKVAIVTGGASGMGLATVQRFLDEGASVIIGDLNADNGRNALETFNAAGHGDRVRFTTTDVSVEGDVAAMTELAVDAFGRLDIVFNNAGIGGAFGPITELDVDDWDMTFHILVRSVFLGIKHAARIMIDQGEGGSIINTGSIAGMGGGAGPEAYSAAKAAVAARASAEATSPLRTAAAGWTAPTCGAARARCCAKPAAAPPTRRASPRPPWPAPESEDRPQYKQQAEINNTRK